MDFLQEFNQCIFAPWQAEYVAYQPMLEGLNRTCNSGHWTSKDEEDFESAIRLEAGKVDLFVNQRQREIESRVLYYERSLLQPAPSVSSASQDATEKALNGLLADIHDLAYFIRINYRALEHLVQHHNKLSKRDLQPVFVEICRTRPLDNQRLDDLLVKTSQLLDTCHQVSFKASPSTPGHVVNAHYWVHQDNVTEVKSVLMFNQSYSEANLSAIYFDQEQFKHYESQLQWDDGAELIYCHWQEDLQTAKEVRIDRKVLTKSKEGGIITQQGIKMSRHRLYDFAISGIFTAEEYKEDLKAVQCDKDYVESSYTIAAAIQQSIICNQLRPKLRANFSRFAIESPHDKTLFVSLDNNITFTKQKEPLQTLDAWYQHNAFHNILNRKDSCRFPHAVLEVHFQGCPPSWLSRILDSKLVHQVPRFSLYSHGVTQFWSPRLPLLPWWLNRLNMPGSDKWMVEGAVAELTRSNSVRSKSHSNYDIGYLEVQLGKSLGRFSNNINNKQQKRELEASIEKQKQDFVVQVEEASPTKNLVEASRVDPVDQRHSFADYYQDGRSSKSKAYMLQNMDSIKQDDALRKAAIIEMGQQVEENKKPKNKKKKIKPPSHTLEPKVFFANERTFINWLQFAALLLTTALTLLNFGDRISTIAGGTFFGISILIAVYAVFRYRYRAHQISTRPDRRYDDPYGPVLLCCLLIGALVLNFVLRWQHPSDTSTYLGVNNKTDEQTNQQ